MRKKVLALSAVALTALAGCGSSTHKSSATTVAPTTPVTTGLQTMPTATTAPVTSTTAPGATTTAPAVTTTVPSGPQTCATADLSGALTSPSGAAGSVYYTLQLTNKGTTPCTMSGYPGVSFVTGASGTQVGAAAARNPGTVATLTLAPGQAASATLRVTVAANYGASCGVTPVAGLRVFPPGQTAALFVAHPDNGCSNTADVLLHVGPVAAG